MPADHPLVDFLKIKVIVDLNNPVDEDLPLIDRLLKPEFFPGSAWLMGLRAATLYHLHGKIFLSQLRYLSPKLSNAADFHRAEKQFDAIRKVDPMRIDDIDISIDGRESDRQGNVVRFFGVSGNFCDRSPSRIVAHSDRYKNFDPQGLIGAMAKLTTRKTSGSINRIVGVDS